MSKLQFGIEWLDPLNAKGDDLRATWASLKIELVQQEASDSTIISRFYDPKVDSRRSRLNLPVYPLAEWLAFHWFQLLHGGERTGSENHDIRRAGGGYALPWLEIWSQGEEVLVRWERTRDESRNLDFESWGEALLLRREVEECLSEFVHKVVHRLNEHSIVDTPLQTEWNDILGLDQEEREFCIAAASLGLDPFKLDGSVEQEILQVGALIPKLMQEEFFSAASSSNFLEQAQAVDAATKRLEGLDKSRAPFVIPKMQFGRTASTTRAWERGYEAARTFRQILGLGDGPVSLGLLLELAEPHELEELAPVQRIEGVVSRNCTSSRSAVRAGFLSRRPENVKFSLARFLGESVLLETSQAALVTKERTTRQKVNRAFAAELLAPAAELSKKITIREIHREDISDLAEEFEVSTYVIENQIQNHNLATIRG